ncbi:MAG: PQQ-binding-like beta-propeller repeat protein [Pirellulaceae bacterium]
MTHVQSAIVNQLYLAIVPLEDEMVLYRAWSEMVPLHFMKRITSFSAMRRLRTVFGVFCLFTASMATADWPQFRGPAGSGISLDEDLPTTWSDSENLRWKVRLPGAGSSSPAVVGDRVYLTAFTGYGIDPANPGQREDLRLHTLALDFDTGEVVWDQEIAASEEEQTVTPRVADHGYASPTPVCDGTAVYAFFGPSGMVAYDLKGNLLWRRNLGTKTAGFGAAASPIVYKDLVIMNASIEDGTLYGLDKSTGETVYRIEGIQRTWTTPTIVRSQAGRDEMIVDQKDRIVAFDPKTGNQLWWCEGVPDYIVPVVVAHDGVVYCSGGRQNKTFAVRAGGDGDVSESHLLWQINRGANVTSPLYHDGHLYWAHDKHIALCVRAGDGEEVYRERMPTTSRVYASIVYGDGKFFMTTRDAGVMVVKANPMYEVLATNRLGDEDEMFNATPAISGGRILLRSKTHLYCVEKLD